MRICGQGSLAAGACARPVCSGKIMNTGFAGGVDSEQCTVHSERREKSKPRTANRELSSGKG